MVSRQSPRSSLSTLPLLRMTCSHDMPKDDLSRSIFEDTGGALSEVVSCVRDFQTPLLDACLARQEANTLTTGIIAINGELSDPSLVINFKCSAGGPLEALSSGGVTNEKEQIRSNASSEVLPFNDTARHHDQRRQDTGTVCRRVSYHSEYPADDVFLSQDACGRVFVRHLQRNGKAAGSGVKVGDELVKIQVGDYFPGFLELGINALKNLPPPVALLFMGFVGRFPAQVTVPRVPTMRGLFRSTRDVVGDSAFDLCEQVVFHDVGASLFFTLQGEPSGMSVASSSKEQSEDITQTENAVPNERVDHYTQSTGRRLYEIGQNEAKKILQLAIHDLASRDHRVDQNAFGCSHGDSRPSARRRFQRRRVEQKPRKQEVPCCPSDVDILASLPRPRSKNRTFASGRAPTLQWSLLSACAHHVSPRDAHSPDARDMALIFNL